MNLFHIDSPIVRILNLLSDLFILHILWLIYSLPVITIGASTTALYYAMMKRIQTDDGTIFHNFHSSFRSNFKQSTILWIFMFLVGMILLLDFYFCNLMQGTIKTILFIPYILILLPYCFTSLYLFPVQAKFDNSIKQNLKNAFLMSLIHLPYTFLLILFPIVMVVILLLSPKLLGFFILFGMGAYSYLTSHIYIRVFRRYIPD